MTSAAAANVSREAVPGSSRRPWLSSAFVAAALLATTASGVLDVFAFRRAAFEDGEVWRALTMHLVHPWPRLALFDLGALLLLGTLLEQRSRGRLAATWLAAGLLAAVAVVFFRPDLHSYHGSSALVAGMLTAVALESLMDGGCARVAGGLLLLLWIGKTAAELAGIWPAVWIALPAGVESVPEAHLAGGLGGAAVAAVSWPSRMMRVSPAITRAMPVSSRR